jgi:hypothetical protein
VRLLLVTLLATTASAASRKEALLFSNCARESGEYLAEIQGRILLHKAFLAGDDVKESIEHQLHYLWGIYRNDQDAHGSMQISLSAEPSDIEILSTREVPYGRDLPLPYATDNPHLKIEDRYTLRAVARGRVKRDDPALAIEYRARFKLAVCGRNADPPAAARVPLPPDPWLAYWHVPRAKHRRLRYFNEFAVTNPCADNDFADLPHPFYYWYDWLPTRHGPDDNGRLFDCREWLKPDVDYRYFDVSFKRISAANRDFARLRQELLQKKTPITATIVVGAVDHAVTDLDLESWRKMLDGGELLERANAALKAWPESKSRERGTRSFLTALAELDGVMTVDKHSVAVDQGYLVVEADGKLKLSARPMRVRVWLGMTDLFGPLPPQHWRILRRALAEDELVLYWGHSGIGENFRLAQIEKNLGIPHQTVADELRQSPLRLVAFISCYSYMYFGQDLLAAGAERTNGAYFVFTGMEHSAHEAGPLAVLDLIDRVLAPDNPSGHVDKMPLLGDDEFWLVKEVAGTSAP